MEKISIVNFAGIKSMDFEIKSINILIGPQGSGKSVTVKLLYFFKNHLPDFVRSVISDESKQEFDKAQVEKFVTFFPKESWPKDSFSITYSLDDIQIVIKKVGNQAKINYSDNLSKLLTRCRKVYGDEKKKLLPEELIGHERYGFRFEVSNKIESILEEKVITTSFYNQFFIPAGRSFFANIQKSIFSFMSDNRSLDPFLIEFGADYENFKGMYNVRMSDDGMDKNFMSIATEILGSSFLREKDKDYLVHDDSRKVNLSNASSGQQETLPLVVTLGILNSSVAFHSGATIYIEEPEAHLFPTAQNAIVRLLARTFNHPDNKYQIIVTTHSPYILSSFNNLMEAGRLRTLKPKEAKKIAKIVPEKEQIDPELVTAYSLKNGKKQSLIDDESKLITQTILDGVSNDIALDFGKLLDIEF